MPGFSGIFYAYVLLNVTLYRKLKRKGERMPEFIWLIIGAVVGIALGFVVTRYLVNASTKRAAQEAESVVNDAKRQAETLRREAIIEAGVTRLRPILMTSASTVLGLIPLALATGEGAAGRVAMGVAVVGGMLVSTLLTLYIVPAMYSYISTDRHKKKA